MYGLSTLTHDGVQLVGVLPLARLLLGRLTSAGYRCQHHGRFPVGPQC